MQEQTDIHIVIRKKDGSIQKWEEAKVISAVQKSANRTNHLLSQAEIEKLLQIIRAAIVHSKEEVLPVQTIHDYVQQALKLVRYDVFQEYTTFRNYKIHEREAFHKLKEQAEGMKYTGFRENANKNSELIPTQRALLSEMTMKTFMKDYVLKPEWVKAHEEGWLYIHDLGDRWLGTHNCCLFDMGNLIKNKPDKGYSFELNNMRYYEPKTILTAFSIVGDIILSASSHQYGGFTVPEIDTVLAPYAEKTYVKKQKRYQTKGMDSDLVDELAMEETIEEIKQGYQSLEYKINSLSNALGQTPFSTITFGLDTSLWGRMISTMILRTRRESENVVFPKLVLYMRKEINRNPESPNYDIYQEALETSSTKLYPDYLSLDGEDNHLAQVYARCGKPVAPMGCRSYLSPFLNDEGEETYTGRANVSVVSLHLVKYALESKGNSTKFYELIDKYATMALDINKWYFEVVSSLKGSSNPLFWVEGGAWKSVGMNDSVAPIVKGFTTSLGFVGVNQALNALHLQDTENPYTNPLDRQPEALQLVEYLAAIVESRKKEDGILHSLYASPAESLCYTFNNTIKNQYGKIAGVSDKEFQTNSFHVDVWEHLSIPAKILYEAPFHQLATGGKIGYVELPFGTPKTSLESVVNFAMDNGMYFGLNIISATCEECGEHGDFLETCPACGSHDITAINRVCGYLSFVKRNGKFSQNPGKISETMLRVDHTGFGNEHTESFYEGTGVGTIESTMMDHYK